MQSTKMADYEAQHFLWEVDGTVATVTIRRATPGLPRVAPGPGPPGPLDGRGASDRKPELCVPLISVDA